MGAKYTESQKKAIKKYMRDKRALRVVAKEEDVERYRIAAKKRGMSLNRFIITCIESAISSE